MQSRAIKTQDQSSHLPTPERFGKAVVRGGFRASFSGAIAAIIGGVTVPLVRLTYGVSLDQSITAVAVVVLVGMTCARLVLSGLDAWAERGARHAATHEPPHLPSFVRVAAVFVGVAILVAFATSILCVAGIAFANLPEMAWAKAAALTLVKALALLSAGFVAASVGALVGGAAWQELRSDLSTAFRALPPAVDELREVLYSAVDGFIVWRHDRPTWQRMMHS